MVIIIIFVVSTISTLDNIYNKNITRVIEVWIITIVKRKTNCKLIGRLN